MGGGGGEKVVEWEKHLAYLWIPALLFTSGKLPLLKQVTALFASVSSSVIALQDCCYWMESSGLMSRYLTDDGCI